MNRQHPHPRRAAVTAAGLILLAILAAPQAALASARGILKEGADAYEQQDFSGAADAFTRAAEAAGESDLDPSVARYDLGTALLQQGQAEPSASSLLEALQTEDLELQQRAYFNRGHALTASSQALEQQQNLPEAINSMREAALMYEQSMRLDPADTDPKISYELALKRIHDLEVQQQQQQDEQDSDDSEQQQQEEQQEEQQDEGSDDQQQQQDQQQQEESDPDSQDPSPPDSPSEQPQQPQQGTPRESEPMTREEAEMLLNAMREEEGAARQQIRVQYGQLEEVEKDW